MLSGTGHGLSRCEQLHDDTGDNAGTNPDIIAVFFGTNDENKVTAAEFKTLYSQMIDKIQAKYQSADIFVFTLLQRSTNTSHKSGVDAFNSAIREIAVKEGPTVVDLCADSGINEYTFLEYTITVLTPIRQVWTLLRIASSTHCMINT